MSNSLDDSIRVAIRVRPLIKRENDCKDHWLVDGDTICQIHDERKIQNTTFTFDRIFSKSHTTLDLYTDFAQPVVLSVMEGINGTLFAYGQTSSGKTYTMTGSMDAPGIIPHALDEVFKYISKTRNREFLLRVSYMEIYNEIITDLLNPKSTNLKIRENVDREISVEKLTEKVVTSVTEVLDVMRFGEKNRHTGGTNMNERSSRSHAIFRMVAESREMHSRNSVENGEFDGAVKVSHLNLVDLAGSERASVTGAEGIRLREGGFINKSLFALGNVINKLSEGENTFVPFRDSKLTRILQNSLGGNAKTSIICAVTPASTDETLSTLQFASRAKRIKNRPEVNEVLDDGTMLKRCRREINELKRKLEKSHSREEVLKREMELQMEKDMIQKELEEQRKVADETKAKLRDLANIFCTAQPKESESKQRKQRRWTVCPMGAHRNSLLQLDMPFDGEFGKPSRRLERSFAGSPSKGFGEEVSSADFNVDSHQRFFDDLHEREEETFADESVISSVGEYRNSLNSANNSEAKIADLESEVKRLTEERDTIRNDLSENISSSCEIQEDLLKTKDKLKEKKQENRALQERLQQMEALHATSDDVSENNNIFEQELLKYKAEIEELNTKLEAAVFAKDAAVTKCQQLQKQQTELEEKVEILNVIQDELTTVDTLQEELVRQQERSKTLQEEISKSEDDKAILRQELELQLGNIAANQKYSAMLDGKVQALNDENLELRMKLEELAAVNSPKQLNEEIEASKTRPQEIEAQNTELRDSCCQFEDKCHGLQYELGEKLSLPVETNAQSCSEDALKVKESEIAVMTNPTSEGCNDKSDIMKDLEKQLAEALETKQALAEQYDGFVEGFANETKLELDEKDAELARQSEELRQLREQLERELAKNSEMGEKEKEYEARNEDMQADNEDFPTETINPEEKLKSSSVAQEELVQYYESCIENLRQEYYAELKKREEMFSEAESKRDEELAQKDATLQEMMGELQRLNAQLEEVELTSTISLESKAIPELHTGLPLSPKCQSGSQECVERKRKHSDELTVVEDRMKAFPDAVERKRLKDDKIAKINEQFDKIDDLKRQLELASAAKEECEESMTKLQHTFGLKLSEKDKEVQDLMEKVKQLEEKLCDTNDTSPEKTSTENTSTEDTIVTEISVNELINKFEQEILQKNVELQQKSLEIETLENSSGGHCDKEHVEMTKRIEKLQEELYQRNEQLHEKICETEHLKLLMGSPSDNESREEMPPCDVNMQEKPSEELDEVNSDCEIDDLKRQLIEAQEANERMLLENDISVAGLHKKYQAELAEKTKDVQDKSKEIDCLTTKLKYKMLTLIENPEVEAVEEEINMLEDELEAANNSVKEMEIRVSEMEARSCEEVNILKEKLEAVVSEKENLVKENEARRVEVEEQFTERISMLKKELEAVISEKNNLLNAKESSIADVETRFREDINLLKEELEAVVSVKENLVKENETRLVDMETQFREEISLLNEKLEASVSEKDKLEKENEACVSEVETRFREQLQKIVLENEGIRKELAEFQGKYDFELAEKDFKIEKILSTCEKLEMELQETMSSKQSLITEHEATIARIKDEFTNEIDQMRCTAKENAKVILELKEKLTKTEYSSVESEELVLQLKEKSDLVAELQEKVKALVESKESLLEQHQTTSDRLQQDFDDQIDSIRQAVEEKERELARAQEENVNTLRVQLDRERERLNEVVNESASQIRELDNKIVDKDIQYEESLVENQNLKEQVENLVAEAKQMSKDFGEKANRVFELESELVKAVATSESLAGELDSLTRLTEERDPLQNDLNSTAEELSQIRNDLQEKSNEVSTLKEEVNQTKQAMENLKNENKSMVEDLQQQNNSLKTDLEKLFDENQNLKTDSESYRDQLQELKEQNSSNTDTQPSEASCENCRRRSTTKQGRRESEVFKSMLEDIKEHIGNEHIEQDKLIDELNHTLVATQERLEQKEFVLDEKEIEIMERDELVEQLREKLATAEQLSALQESKNAELLATFEQETAADIANWRAKLKCTEEELHQAKCESEKAIGKLTHERNALQEKLQDYESVVSKEQLRELYNTMEEKSQRIADLEQHLNEMNKKDSKICELEMEIDILQGEIVSFKGRSDGDQQSIHELQQKICEQETHIVQLEACKAGLTLERDETIAGELQDLRLELDDARLRLAGLEEERNHRMKVMQEKTELLTECQLNIAIMEENLLNKDKKLCEASKKLEKALGDVNERDISGQRTAEQLRKSRVEIGDLKNSFETVSDELQRVKIELQKRDEVIKKLNSDVHVAEGALKKAMSDKFESDEIVNIKEAECKRCEEKIRDLEIQQNVQSKELEATKLRHISVSGELEKYKVKIMQLDQQYNCRIAELTTQNTDKTTAGCQGNQEQISKVLEAKDKELAKLDEEVNKAFRIVRTKNTECTKLTKALQECEDEITDFKNQIEKLMDENEELNKKLQNKHSNIGIHEQQEQSPETDTLRSKVSSLEAEVQHLRKRSDMNLEEELKKAKNELKTKELDLFNVNFEKSKQLDSAMSKICELEKDIANYGRKNNELKAEIRSLRNREEPTTDLIHRRPPSSSNGENVGVVGSVALFTLNARVEKLTDEKKQLQNKSEALQKEVDKLAIINLDLKQRYEQITMKYNRLKEKFVGYLETQQKMNEPPKTEQSTGAELQARIDKQQIQPVIKSQNNDPTFTQPTALSSESTPCHPAHDDNPEFKEQDNQPTLKDDSSEPSFRPRMSTIAFQPSTESAFRKPPNVSAEKPSSTEVKPAGPIPSHQASKPVCSTVGLPRRVEPKQSGAMQAGRKQTAEVGQTVGVMQASNQASRETRKQSKTSYSKQNKENSLYDSQEKPDACKSN